jgi:SAM-dependent methyltransferase
MRSLVDQIRRFVAGRVTKRWGTAAAKKQLWDKEFADGQWNYLESTEDDPIYIYLGKYARNGSILDLGCGSGNTGNELDSSKYASYTGVDVSSVAVEKARVRSAQNGRQAKNEYFCGDIENFTPSRAYHLILFRESIFYIPVGRIPRVLEHYTQYLSEKGVFVVRMCDREKYEAIVNLIGKNYTIVEAILIEGYKDVILVFMPGPQVAIGRGRELRPEGVRGP